jgi:hypothetical protein
MTTEATKLEEVRDDNPAYALGQIVPEMGQWKWIVRRVFDGYCEVEKRFHFAGGCPLVRTEGRWVELALVLALLRHMDEGVTDFKVYYPAEENLRGMVIASLELYVANSPEPIRLNRKRLIGP